MASNLGARLLRLIKERAYLSGSMDNLKEAVRLAELNLATSKKELEFATRRLEEIGQQITEESAIELSDIAAVKAKPRIGKGSHGQLRRFIVDVLKSGHPIKTVDLVKHAAPIFGWDLSTVKGRRFASDSITGPLCRFRKKGVVERLRDEMSESGQPCGVWRWIGEPSQSHNELGRRE